MGNAQQLVVLGGGMSSLVTLLELTSQPDWQARWKRITVYQLGWRLGGKGASGRNPEQAQRIEEHGLHLLFGCYENTFRLLDAVYADMPREPRERRWTLDQALEPHDHVVMFENTGTGWKPWTLDTVRRPGFPGRGDPVELGARNYIDLLLRWALQQVQHWIGGEAAAADGAAPAAPAHPHASGLFEHLREARDLAEQAFGFAAESAVAAAARGLMDWDGVVDGMVALLERGLGRLRELTEPSPELRHAIVNVEFTLTVLKGLLRDRVLERGRENWSAIDGYDLRDWLARHGASKDVLDSAPTRGLYAAIFSDKRRVAAGAILHALMRASHFKGAAIYKMKAGMGDTIFAPIYRVLRARGVHFEFFHRVESLELSPDRRRVERIQLNRQVRLRDPAAEYEPLVEVNGLPCWPNRPRVEALAAEEADTIAHHDLEDWWDPWQGRETVTLSAGRDFDRVLLGISIGAFPDVCRELIEDSGNPRFAKMVHSVVTRETQSPQLWMAKDAKGLGWSTPPVVIPYESPFDTWAEMSHLLEEEDHGSKVQSLQYLCTGMDDDEPPPPARLDPDYPRRQRARVREHLRAWLESSAPRLWPGAASNGQFDWNVLDDPLGRSGEERLAAQYWIAVQNPSDRYVLAAPGSTAHRLRAEESGYDNLVLTGDWTLNDMNVGCLEGATMAGIRSARALDPRVPLPVYAWLPEPAAPANARSAAGAARARAVANYVLRDGEMLCVPPIDLDVELASFFVAADPKRLQTLCDRELNLGGGRRYRPAGPFVVFYASKLDNQVAEGSIEELDFGVWVPVFAGSEAGGGFRAEALLTYSPYVWVSNSPAVVGGRSVFGFPKHVADLKRPERPGDPARFLADTWLVDAQGGRARQDRLLEIERCDAPTWPGQVAHWDLPGMARLLERLLASGGPLPQPTLELLMQLLRPASGMPMVFLKELPAADGSGRASYQAILEAPVEITGRREGGAIEGRWEVRARACWSHDLARNLGLAHRRVRRDGVTWCVMPALAQGWMSFQSRVQPGRIIWQAPA